MPKNEKIIDERCRKFINESGANIFPYVTPEKITWWYNEAQKWDELGFQEFYCNNLKAWEKLNKSD